MQVTSVAWHYNTLSYVLVISRDAAYFQKNLGKIKYRPVYGEQLCSYPVPERAAHYRLHARLAKLFFLFCPVNYF